ncbi:hypothetical protein FBU59_000994, partial [Linderina macrospora]
MHVAYSAHWLELLKKEWEIAAQNGCGHGGLEASAVMATPMPDTTDSLAATDHSVYGPSLIVFGDSQSDNGSTFHYSNRTVYPFGGRYSNSYMWNEYVAKLLNLNLENWAIGGSTNDNKFVPGYGRTQIIPSTTDMVAQYITNNTNASVFKKCSSIVVVGGGSNSLLYSLDSFADGSIDMQTFVDTLVNNLFDNVKNLLDAGYPNIYLLTMPSLNVIPGIVEYGITELTQTIAPMFDMAFRRGLWNLFWTYGPRAFGVSLFDLGSVYDLMAKPESLSALNITTVNDWCVTYAKGGSELYCSDPDTRYFYDDFHASGRI